MSELGWGMSTQSYIQAQKKKWLSEQEWEAGGNFQVHFTPNHTKEKTSLVVMESGCIQENWPSALGSSTDLG